MKYVDDPGLSLTEALAVMGEAQQTLGVVNDAVLLSGWEKLRDVCVKAAEEDPEEFEQILEAIKMQEQLGSKARRRRV